MEKLSIGQVVLASFPFSDLSSNKLRPCLIIGNAEFDDIIVCQITSQRYHSKNAVKLLEKKDFRDGSIIQNSFIRPDKIATLDTKTIRQVLGTVKEPKLTEVKQVLQEVLKIQQS